MGIFPGMAEDIQLQIKAGDGITVSGKRKNVVGVSRALLDQISDDMGTSITLNGVQQPEVPMTSDALPGTLAYRDGSGRAKVAAPAVNDDIANKYYVDKAVSEGGGVSLIEAGTFAELPDDASNGTFAWVQNESKETGVTTPADVGQIPVDVDLYMIIQNEAQSAYEAIGGAAWDGGWYDFAVDFFANWANTSASALLLEREIPYNEDFDQQVDQWIREQEQSQQDVIDNNIPQLELRNRFHYSSEVPGYGLRVNIMPIYVSPALLEYTDHYDGLRPSEQQIVCPGSTKKYVLLEVHEIGDIVPGRNLLGRLYAFEYMHDAEVIILSDMLGFPPTADIAKGWNNVYLDIGFDGEDYFAEGIAFEAIPGGGALDMEFPVHVWAAHQMTLPFEGVLLNGDGVIVREAGLYVMVDGTWKMSSGSSVTVDGDLDISSKNPVSNKAVTAGINGVESLANQAQYKAQSAQSTAQTALSTVIDVQLTANTALSAAQGAQLNADFAVGEAISANNAANKANNDLSKLKTDGVIKFDFENKTSYGAWSNEPFGVFLRQIVESPPPLDISAFCGNSSGILQQSQMKTGQWWLIRPNAPNVAVGVPDSKFTLLTDAPAAP